MSSLDMTATTAAYPRRTTGRTFGRTRGLVSRLRRAARRPLTVLASCAAACCLCVCVPAEAGADGWSVARQDGVAWLVDPQGKPFYSKGVNIVNGWPDQGLHDGDPAKAMDFPAFYWGRWFKSEDDWRRQAGKQLSSWGFNTRGGWSDVSSLVGLPYIVELDLGRAARLHWIDLFDPASERLVEQAAERLTAPYRGDPLLIGYFTDNEVGWWNSRIFRHYLNDPWDSHSKRAVFGIVRDHYDGDWARLLVDFVPGPGMTDWESLKKEGAFLGMRPGGQGIRLIDKVCAAVARRYYSLVQHGLRKAHPEALVMGDRLPLYYNQHAVLAMRDYVDVVSTNYNVDVQDGWVAPYYFEGLERLTGKPVLVSEFFYAAKENRSGNVNNGHLMTVDTQEERARGAAKAVRAFARFPGVVGSHWFQYYDEPPSGRQDGENYNFGLVDVRNQPYELLTAGLTAAHAEVEAIHGRAGALYAAEGAEDLASAALRNAQGASGAGAAAQVGDASANSAGRSASGLRDVAAPQVAQAAVSERQGREGLPAIRRASRPISVADDSLVDWDKAATRLTGFHTPAPFVPFGDVHMAWTPEGLYLFCIAQSYLDWTALSYEGKYPLSEAFQLHLRLDGPGGLRHYAVCLSPEKSERFYDYDKPKMEVPPRLYRWASDGPEVEMAEAGLVQAISRPLPHIAFEVFLPAELLGFDRFEDGQTVDMALWVASFYRELTMTWGGPDGSLRPVRLEGSSLVADQARPE